MYLFRAARYVGLLAKQPFLKKVDRKGDHPGLEVEIVVVEAVSGDLVGDVEVKLEEIFDKDQVVATHVVRSSPREPIKYRFNPPEKVGGRYFLKATVADEVCF